MARLVLEVPDGDQERVADFLRRGRTGQIILHVAPGRVASVDLLERGRQAPLDAGRRSEVKFPEG